jgi:hypothetical protein
VTRGQVPVVLTAVAVGPALGLGFDLGDAPERLVVGPLVELPVLALTADRLRQAPTAGVGLR